MVVELAHDVLRKMCFSLSDEGLRAPKLTLADGRLDTFGFVYLEHSSALKSLVPTAIPPAQANCSMLPSARFVGTYRDVLLCKWWRGR